MHSATATPETVRGHAQLLLTSIGVSRIIVVDDEYAEEHPEVEQLLGICAVLDAAQAAELPHLDGIDFEADREIWVDIIRDKWEKLDDTARRMVLAQARTSEAEVSPSAAGGELAATLEHDTKAAKSLEEILDQLDECEYVTLSLFQWRARRDELLADDKAATTVLLFDRDFHREENGAEDEGFKLIREAQVANVGYCGLISHTVHLGSEHDAWISLAIEHSLVRDKFVVIAKERLTGESPDYYRFLYMLRFVALSGRYADVKSAAWSVFESSVSKAKAAVERLSTPDFDRIVFGSSRREGVWEPDTLLRVFGILMRREARSQLYQDADISTAVAEARRISAIPEDVAAALDEESASPEALRIQRFESYESDDELNQFHVPIELGDIFERDSNGQRYILLVQPCDLMVRPNGKRSYEDDKHGRTGSLVELVVGRDKEKVKESWGELPFYDQDTGISAIADFAKVHQALLAVLDLCALREDGVARIDVEAASPELLIEPWKMRYKRLQKFFNAALTRYKELEDKQLSNELKMLALPRLSTTVRVQATVSGQTVQYDLKRVMRLRQPRSGALLTAFAQYQARVAFEHPFDHRVTRQLEANGDQEPDKDEEFGATG